MSEAPVEESKSKKKGRKHPLETTFAEWHKGQSEDDEQEPLDFLYPRKNDPDFAKNIAQRKEFNDTKYDIVIPTSQRQMEEEAAKLCGAAFELAPHQLFVRNFLSVMTPYNSLLLYHGLGTGKTCSAISVAEEMRDYMTQVGIFKKILVVASVNVQDNFRKQLFDFNKLKFNRVARQFVIRGCTGTKLLKEVGGNAELADLTEQNVERVRAGIVQRVTRLINASYEFMGYIELANTVRRLTAAAAASKHDAIRAIKNAFNHRLLIVDEIHNVRSDEEAKEGKEGKSVSEELYKLVRYADNLRLLLLSGTPMYNDPREIVWLLNLMNVNDRRAPISVGDVFDRDGNLLPSVGAELLRIKSNGYISVVKGENPYIFPFRMYPADFAPAHSYTANRELHPAVQLNATPIPNPIQHLDIFLNRAGAYQEAVYDHIIQRKRLEMSAEATSFGSFLLKQPIEALNMVYPSSEFDKMLERAVKDKGDKGDKGDKDKAKEAVSVADTAVLARINIGNLLGDAGLKRVMKHDVSEDGARIYNFEYKPTVVSKYGRIFSRAEIGKYSSKIASICEHVDRANGVVLIYSEYIGGGAVPIALALEEMGFTRYDTQVGSLFKTAPVPQRVQEGVAKKRFAAKYAMFTGDKQLSPDNRAELEALTTDNEWGQRIKVVIISKAGSEGIDFKNVRQVHIMEPWYNMNRIEQIVGRAVRNCSHADLPFVERNVQLFLHGTLLAQNPDTETADLYVYRLAETKAAQIGQVSRILKENAVDCLLNIDQTKFSQEVIRRHNGDNVTVRQVLSDGTQLAHYAIGDRPFSFVCDYQARCEYQCASGGGAMKIRDDTYSQPFLVMNADRIRQRIRDLFRVQHFYARRMLMQHLSSHPREQIDMALTHLIRDKGEQLVDKYGRTGRLINVGEYYLFQPAEITDPRIDAHDRSAPLQFKRDHISFPLNDGTLERLAEQHGLKPPQLRMGEGTLLNSLPSKMQAFRAEYDAIIAAVASPLSDKSDKSTKTWNELCPDVLRELRDRFRVPMDTLEMCTVQHFLDDFMWSGSDEQQVQYLNWLYSASASKFDQLSRAHFDAQILKNPKYAGEEGVLILNPGSKTGVQLVVRKNAESVWGVAKSSEEWRPYMDQISQLVQAHSLAHIIGFVSNFKEKNGGSYAVFKIKYVNEKGGGARCDQISSKQRRLTIANQILSGMNPDAEPVYTMENTKNQNTARYCVLSEMLLRSYNFNKKDNKHWFLTPVQTTKIANA
jgi:superfamily II DNA or RNA helicase|uniref:Helicase C-terminal domain-containing protein n=1 Tax=viral metagenome TaxID=1070528 RepID=A0A6C0M0U3_9ZZZZ